MFQPLADPAEAQYAARLSTFQVLEAHAWVREPPPLAGKPLDEGKFRVRCCPFSGKLSS